jgi:hypothetical protein
MEHSPRHTDQRPATTLGCVEPLKTTKATPGRDGDRLAGTTFIQRVNTTGGVNPTPGGDCTADLPVPYTADYYFYKATGNANSKPVI